MIGLMNAKECKGPQELIILLQRLDSLTVVISSTMCLLDGSYDLCFMRIQRPVTYSPQPPSKISGVDRF